ncbi:MAG TPA: PilZ domain-containing protein [Deltaproteobacteria bacterium]|nr:PilZ domain-containing protein [Deltaproteobacteria bacterium]
MHSEKDKRTLERIHLKDMIGSVEHQEKMNSISIINASEDGVCIEGANLELDSVVRLAINQPQDTPGISLYCKVVWVSPDEVPGKKSGLLFLNTNRVLFKNDLISFNRLIDSARKQANQ